MSCGDGGVIVHASECSARPGPEPRTPPGPSGCGNADPQNAAPPGRSLNDPISAPDTVLPWCWGDPGRSPSVPAYERAGVHGTWYATHLSADVGQAPAALTDVVGR